MSKDTPNTSLLIRPLISARYAAISDSVIEYAEHLRSQTRSTGYYKDTEHLVELLNAIVNEAQYGLQFLEELQPSEPSDGPGLLVG